MNPFHSLESMFLNLRNVDNSGAVTLSDQEGYSFDTAPLGSIELLRMERGLYVVVDRLSGFVYVGSANDCRKIARQVRHCLRTGVHKNQALSELFAKSGEHNFYVTVIYCQDVEVITATVQTLLNRFRNQGVILNTNFRTKVAGAGTGNHYDDTVYTCYTFTHRQTGKFYVGTSKSPAQRKGTHLWNLKNNHHVNPLLQDLWNHDSDPTHWDWKFTVLGNKEDAYNYEQSIITANEGNGLMLNLATDVWDNIGSCTTADEQAKNRKNGQASAAKSLSRAITVLGVDYASASAAAVILGKNQTTVSRWANDPTDERAYWREGPKKTNGWTEEVRARARGENNSVSKRIVIDGEYYGSVKEAAAATGRDEKWLRHQARDREVTNIYWG